MWEGTRLRAITSILRKRRQRLTQKVKHHHTVLLALKTEEGPWPRNAGGLAGGRAEGQNLPSTLQREPALLHLDFREADFGFLGLQFCTKTNAQFSAAVTCGNSYEDPWGLCPGKPALLRMGSMGSCSEVTTSAQSHVDSVFQPQIICMHRGVTPVPQTDSRHRLSFLTESQQTTC